MAGGVELDREDSRKARMLYDYDAVNTDEISINSGEASAYQLELKFFSLLK